MEETEIIPQFPQKLPGTFWGVTSFFDPAKYKNKADNYRIFRKKSKKQGLKLLTVELAFDDYPFQLKSEDADILIQIRGESKKSLMWQKEALINIGIKKLPANCDKVAWVDCDVLFKNNNWIEETSELLEKYMAVQPFSYYVRLPKGINDATEKEIEDIKKGSLKTKDGFSSAFGFVGDAATVGQPGFCWAFRKDIILKHSMFNEMILCSADLAMFFAFLGDYKDKWLKRLNQNQFSHYSQWAESIFKDIQKSVYYTKGTILHLWHGEFEDRLYDTLHEVLNFFEFDPGKDIKISSNGLLEWASEKQNLHKAVGEYFEIRNEEGGNVLTSFIINRLNSVKNSLSSVQRELSSTKDSLSSVQRELSSTKDSLSSVQRELSSTKNYLNSVLGSLSWKITAPLRYIHSKTLFRIESHGHATKEPSFFYYESADGNFGDSLASEIIYRIIGKKIESTNLQKKPSKVEGRRFLSLGSIMHFSGNNDYVWGTGMTPTRHEKALEKLEIFSVRGPLTREFIIANSNNSCPDIYGDPALLMPILFPELKKKTQKGKITVIPHHTDKDSKEILNAKKTGKYNIVYPFGDWRKVLNEILESELVISSSLHGIICAEAFNVPARWLYSEDLPSSNGEGIFKYNDYYLSTNRSTDDYARSIEEAMKLGGKGPIIDFNYKKLLLSFPFHLFNVTFLQKVKLKLKYYIFAAKQRKNI